MHRYMVIFFAMFFPSLGATSVICDSEDTRIVVECVAGICVYTDMGSGTQMTCEQAEKRLFTLQARRAVLTAREHNDNSMREIFMIDGEMRVLHVIVGHSGCRSHPHNKVTPPKKRGEYYAAVPSS